MVIYFSPYFYFFLVSGIEALTRRPLRSACWLGAGALIVFTGLRSDVDNDFSSYVYYFDQLPPLSDGFGNFFEAATDIYLEPFFSFLISTLKSVVADKWLFICIAAISISIYAFVFTTETRTPASAFLIYVADGFYLREFTQVRFGLAVALCALGFYYYRTGHTRRFTTCVVLGGLLHYATFFALILPPWLRVASKTSRLLWVSTGLLFASTTGAFDQVTQWFANSSFAPVRIAFYAGTSDAESVSAIFILIQYLILLALLTVQTKDERYNFYVKVFALSFAILCIFSSFDLLRRISFVFATSLYVLFALNVSARRVVPIALILVLSITLLVMRLNILQPYAAISLIN